MDFALLFLIINILFFGGIAYYFSVQRKQLQDAEEQALKRHMLEGDESQREKNEIQEEIAEAREKSEFIITESEKLAQELIVSLEEAVGRKEGKREDVFSPEIPIEEQLGFLKEKIKKEYVDKIRSLLKRLERFEMQKAMAIEKFAQEQEARADIILQKVRIEELEKMRVKIETYKNAEIALFDKKVKEVVNSAAMDILGHALTNQEQEELIINAVKKAREEKIL
jgi:hypothetical protein